MERHVKFSTRSLEWTNRLSEAFDTGSVLASILLGGWMARRWRA